MGISIEGHLDILHERAVDAMGDLALRFSPSVSTATQEVDDVTTTFFNCDFVVRRDREVCALCGHESSEKPKSVYGLLSDASLIVKIRESCENFRPSKVVGTP